MWAWLNRYPKRSTETDIRFLTLLCLGHEPNHKSDVQQRIGQNPFAVCKAFLTSRSFLRGLLEPLALGKKPAQQLFTQEQQKLLAIGLKRHFRLKTDAGSFPKNHCGIVLLALQSQRFMRAVAAAQPAYSPAWLLEKLPDILPQPNVSFIGRIEQLSATNVQGYALDINNTDTSLTLDFYINDSYVGSTQTTGIRRDVQEIYNGNGLYGFDHSIVLPAHLAAQDNLVLNIFDHESNIQLCPPCEFSPISAKNAHYVQKLVAELSLARQAVTADSKPHTHANLLQKLDTIETALPHIEQYAAFPLEEYSVYKHFYTQPAPPITERDAPTTTVATTPTTVAASKADIIILCPTGCVLEPGADAWIKAAAEANPEASLFYADFDHLDDTGTYSNPNFKTTLDIDMLLQQPSYATAFAIRRSALEELNGLHQNMKSAIWYDFWLRVYACHGSAAFCHIPQTLWHFTDKQSITMDDATVALKTYFSSQNNACAISTHSDTYGGSLTDTFTISWPINPDMPMLAIIIPTRDALDLTKACVDSIRRTLAHPYHTEIIIVDNGSQEAETRKWLRNIDNMDGIRVIVHDGPFNWAEINNRAVDACASEYLLFLNNDTLALDHGWDTILRGYLHRDDIGAIGARLLFEDGSIQHAGVILNNNNLITHEGIMENPTLGGYNNRTKLVHSCSAVTGAFLACSRENFEKVGKFDAERFPITFNDIDFCLKLMVAGKKNIYVPKITFSHLESKSRGYDRQEKEKEKRAQNEHKKMQEKWGETFKNDPWYPQAFLAYGYAFSKLTAP